MSMKSRISRILSNYIVKRIWLEKSRIEKKEKNMPIKFFA